MVVTKGRQTDINAWLESLEPLTSISFVQIPGSPCTLMFSEGKFLIAVSK